MKRALKRMMAVLLISGMITTSAAEFALAAGTQSFAEDQIGEGVSANVFSEEQAEEKSQADSIISKDDKKEDITDIETEEQDDDHELENELSVTSAAKEDDKKETSKDVKYSGEEEMEKEEPVQREEAKESTAREQENGSGDVCTRAQVVTFLYNGMK